MQKANFTVLKMLFDIGIEELNDRGTFKCNKIIITMLAAMYFVLKK